MRESTSCSLLGQQLAQGAPGMASSLCGQVSALPWVPQSTDCQEYGHIRHLHTDCAGKRWATGCNKKRGQVQRGSGVF